ncbi:P27 family phage terminase small subunit [Aerococcus urinae]|uniref:P27 family phage terminase small subunit n=1 Tax=Aerococcus mictus TaxID=2976810 RepID=A0A1E9PPP6_9LACT|nr:MULTISPECIES: P27 family phage terminase small subunit [Aerococcus]KAA9292930.1 P27 family phage terminase small subunit [Aerococcus mictus]MBU5610455.1 P27 family phage terminase small subunit [Aerococcus urinae]MCY3064970.1 P27 family phage terminase small subunit [Aerococcus mictus]MCY3076221.1 P27 family phage terminase small subunit [Aerococcus mictus]MCY3081406.1 P27 family phage terminase small subunit [Aerococcus mictus]
MRVSDLKKQMMSRIDPNDTVEVEKVERYVKMVRYIKKLEAEISKEGLTTVTKNGQQEFRKSNPATEIWIKLNKELPKLEKAINFIDEEETKAPTKKGKVTQMNDVKARMLGRG